jgi:WW domain-binding protein 4
MSEYWKSIPRKYCEFCKVWFQDNKSSVEFHERGLKHQGNVRKHLTDVRKRGVQKEREQSQMSAEMRKIEQAALIAYDKDLIAAGKSPSGLSVRRAVDPIKKEEEEDNRLEGGGRFGDQSDSAERSKQAALEMISKKMSKRAEWYESKTIEGKVYYYNRVTYGQS